MRNSIDRILVIVVSRIGDTLLNIPAIRSISNHYPDSKITVLAHPKRLEVLSNLDFVDYYGKITKYSAYLKGWFAKKFDLAFVYSNDEQILKFALRSSIRVISYKHQRKNINKKLFKSVVLSDYEKKTSISTSMALPKSIGILQSSWTLEFNLSSFERTFVENFLNSNNLEKKFIIGIQAVSFPTKAYRDWPIEKFADLFKQILRIKPDSIFLLYGGNHPIEIEKITWLHQKFRSNSVSLLGLSLRKTAAIMSRNHLFIGVDTGPSHLMSCFERPMVVLYHCLYKSQNVGIRRNKNFQFVDHPATSSCYEGSSMNEIEVEEVFQRIKLILNNEKV